MTGHATLKGQGSALKYSTANNICCLNSAARHRRGLRWT